ncbi:TIGR03557 family F420-dependent LLM class oxidoreductase [Cellulomonas sp. URHE0023]|uniref:TIGR03557 family F420-dependent LLM class oxidoreductase n=1 Tax=Cellulomonas sp. URHE0023 TaxID=1380354 RepID=UPI00048163DF|nr:TIGR03557 family F420-dependent LLM class oxidoreductase [Cellulomonas sp. URHE0023]
MTRFGYTLMTEQSGPKDLVRYSIAAERLGFDFEVASDHYFPWLDAQGHAPYAWSLLGAVAQATQSVELMTYVTCPTLRYHPAVVAQKAATLGVLSDGRFQLNVGAGENLNEHVVGERWPAVGERHDLLEEAVEIIRALLTGDRVNYAGNYFQVDSAKVWDLPDEPIQIGAAVSGPDSIARFATLADHLVAVEPDADAVRAWDDARGDALPETRKIGQVPISWDRDKDRAVARAHEQFRWFAGGWKVNADLPTTEAFEAASQFVRPEDVAEQIACGPDLDAIVESVSPYWEAGFTDVAIVQVGDEGQDEFLEKAAGPLLERLRSAAPTS